MKDLIMFDLDGTLWDAAQSVADSWNDILVKRGCTERISADEMRSYMGRTMVEIADGLLAAHPQEERLDILEECCVYSTGYLATHGGDLMPQLEQTLTALSARYDLAIVSNCQKGYIESFLAFHHLERYFVDTECFGNTGLPKDASIRILLSRHDYDKSIYVGDTQKDCDAAEKAGVPFVHASYGYGTIDHVVPALSAFADLEARAESLLNGVPFYPADILLPKDGFEKWAVIACDQFTSEPAYWQETAKIVGDAPSALRLVFPEVYLENEPEKRIAAINSAMADYLTKGLQQCYPEAMIYVERTLPDGSVRQGLVGMIDLEYYAFKKEDVAAIRATEEWVPERIPPRVAIRADAPMELPHVQLLIDDASKTVIEPLTDAELPLLYDFDLMQGGGHIRGYLVQRDKQTAILQAMGQRADSSPLLFAVGDGNHSLITAKTCYQQNLNPYNRYALVEVVNIHDPSMEFEPIYRVLFNVDVPAVVAEMQAAFAAETGTQAAQRIQWFSGKDSGEIAIPHPVHRLTIGTIQTFIDGYVQRHPETVVDYIHGKDSLKALAAQPNAVGFLTDGIAVAELFPAITANGVLPRKTISIGEAKSKRYYVEARKIR